MNKTRVMLAQLLGVVIAGAGFGYPQQSPAASQAPAARSITLKYVHAEAEGSTALMFSAKPFADEVERLTEGRVKFTTYPRGALASPTQNYELVRTGAADIAWVLPGYTPGRFPMSQIGALPFAWANAVQGSLAVAPLLERGLFAKETADTKLLSMHCLGIYYLFTSKKKVTSLADMKGLKIRTSGDYQIKAVSRLGMTPVAMDLGETVSAVQTGVVDGIIMSYGIVGSFGFAPFLKYAYELPFFAATGMWVVNKDVWNRISPRDQRIIEIAAMQAALRYSYSEDLIADIRREQFRGRGMEITKPSEADLNSAIKTTQPIWGEWVADVEKLGHPAKQAMTALELMRKELGIGWKPTK